MKSIKQQNNKAKKQLTYALLFSCFVVFLLSCNTAFAQQTIQTAPAAPINLAINIGGTKSVADLAAYIGVLYKWFVGAAMVIAAFMITVGGFQYVASAGIPKNVASAKTRIKNALIGLVLVLGSYVLLYSISPDFVNLKLPTIRTITRISLPASTCPIVSPDFKCGQSYTNKDSSKVPKGSTCVGAYCDGGASCMSSTIDGNTTSKCVTRSNCPASCGGINQATLGADWQNYCSSDICNQSIKTLCYIVAVPTPQRPDAKACVARPDTGEACDAEKPCRPGALCDDSSGTCQVVVTNLREGQTCTDDNQCASKGCNYALDSRVGYGKCSPIGGAQNESAACTWGLQSGLDHVEGVCGRGWKCIIGQGGNQGYCSNLVEGSLCSPNDQRSSCTDTTNDTCVVGSGDPDGYGRCKMKQTPPNQSTP